MEKCIMKITNLTINKLYGYNDYSIDFNKDVTFLYGENGCGKTTILNIITYIITGKIYELCFMKFNQITLKYFSVEEKKHNKLDIVYCDDGLKVSFENEETLIKLHNSEYPFRSIEDKDEMERFYFSKYSMLNEIRKKFNYIYLPLNRNGNIVGNINGENNIRISPTKYNARNRSLYGVDIGLREVDALVRSAYNRVNFVLKQISEKFSNELLRSFLDVDSILTTEKVFGYMQSLNEKKIRSIQTDYISALKTMEKLGQDTEVKINTFFDSLVSDINSKNQNANLIFKFAELAKISTVISKAEKAEQDKKKQKQAIDDFITTINSFISNGKYKKELYIDTEGTIYLKTPSAKKIDINHLSSGEKQIVTFFAYLIFGLEKTNQSIFIVDEPELSLHLTWQRQFVDSIIRINPNVQLIFATHAPEIIGKHRDKTVKLEPKS